MKTGREWLLVESSKLQHRRQTVADSYCVIRNLTVESAELSDHNVSTNERIDMSERLSPIQEYIYICQIRWCSTAELLTNVHIRQAKKVIPRKNYLSLEM